MKKRTIYIILLLVITIAAVFYGISRHGHLVLSTDGEFAFGFVGKEETEVSKDTGSFRSLDVRLAQDDIRVESGKNFGWSYTGPKGPVPSVEVTDRTLVVTEGEESGNGHSRSGGVLTVTIPSGSWDLGQVTLSTENGDISFEPDEVAAVKEMQLSSSNGDLSLSGPGCSGDALNASSSNGDIELENACFGQFDTESSNGDITISLSDSLSYYTITPSTSVGDITVGDDQYSMEDGGTKKISIGNGEKTIKASTSMGDINIDD